LAPELIGVTAWLARVPSVPNRNHDECAGTESNSECYRLGVGASYNGHDRKVE
jgi:hypothetical protein